MKYSEIKQKLIGRYAKIFTDLRRAGIFDNSEQCHRLAMKLAKKELRSQA